MTKNATVTVRIESKDLEKFKQVCKKQKRSYQDVIRNFIKEYKK